MRFIRWENACAEQSRSAGREKVTELTDGWEIGEENFLDVGLHQDDGAAKSAVAHPMAATTGPARFLTEFDKTCASGEQRRRRRQ